MTVGELRDKLGEYRRDLEVVVGCEKLPVGGIEDDEPFGRHERLRVWIIPNIESLYEKAEDIEQLVFYPIKEEKLICK